ncbi:hypothetical protein RQP46_005864 [Phenoliferia psychrophenolica]
MLSKYSSAQLVVLIGATTSSSTNAIIDHFANVDPKAYRLRTLTPDAALAESLRATGLQVFPGELADAGDVDSVLTGAHIAVVIGDVWAEAGSEKELKEFTLLVDAAKKLGVKLFWVGKEAPKTDLVTYAQKHEVAFDLETYKHLA